MQIHERPKCAKCGEYALCLSGKIWLCGLHMKELQEKIDNYKMEMILHG